jgi:diaminobutyrate-2-oxoglutarate transaminase
MSNDRFSNLHLSDSAKVVVEPPGPRSREMLQKQEDIESAAVSYPKAIPVAFAEGKGATLKDVDGNIYMDFFAGAGVVNIGHCNPEVIEAVREQIGKLTHTLDFPTPIRMEFVDELLPVLPAKLRSMRYLVKLRLVLIADIPSFMKNIIYPNLLPLRTFISILKEQVALYSG